MFKYILGFLMIAAGLLALFTSPFTLLGCIFSAGGTAVIFPFQIIGALVFIAAGRWMMKIAR